MLLRAGEAVTVNVNMEGARAGDYSSAVVQWLGEVKKGA